MPVRRAPRFALLASIALAGLTERVARADGGLPAAGQEAAKQPEPPPASPPTIAPAPPVALAPTAAPPASASPAAAPAGAWPVHTWELPPIDVLGDRKPTLREEERVGDYAQPRWSAQRRFPNVRMFVVPKGKVEFEWWLRYTAPFASPTGRREMRSYYEFEFGLGHRLQFDVYLVAQQGAPGTAIELKREQIELRYALADWGKLWGNPTLYLEYQHRNGENDWLEGKILLGGQLAPRWHAGFNLVLERELAGKQEDELDVTTGVSYSAVDSIFHVGAELYAEVHDVIGQRFAFAGQEQLFLAGPSFMVSPIPPAHILIAPLFGAGRDGPGSAMEGKFRLWFVTGWSF